MFGEFKQKLLSSKPVFGSLAFLPSPDIIEIFGLCGFHYVIIDLEHSPKNWDVVMHMVRTAQLHNVAPLIRVADNVEKQILHALEVGAEGIAIPFVRNADDVAKAVQSIRYAPEGIRGLCTASRAARFGTLRKNFSEYTVGANRNISLIALIEDMEGVDSIEDILDCDPGVDVVLIGRSDLSASLGLPGQADHPKVIEAANRVIEAVNKHRRPVQAGILTSPGDTQRWLDAGCRFLVYGTDSDLMLQAAKHVSDTFAAATGATQNVA